ncbi:MAG: large subunit ribosomal protein L6 [Parcubacteria group bacterium Gr01-1014_20]|nr:MAG: large subunit ribosomal protein L6 [Parcubacteria group bacterium Gr01-1014_20]
MSRLAKKPIELKSGVSLVEDGGFLVFKGSKGEHKVKVLPFVNVVIKDATVSVTTNKSMKQARANLGTMWSLIRNAIDGVSEGFKKVLEVEGIGFKANMDGKTLVLSLGFVNPIRVEPPKDISVSVEKNTILVSGIDKELVGRIAAEIRALKKPEPYKGKGIHYQGEVIRRKAGKKATATAG